MPIYPAGRVCEMAECYKDAETHLVPADDLSLHVDPPAHGSGLDSGPLTCRDSQVTSYWLTSRDPALVTIKLTPADVLVKLLKDTFIWSQGTRW